MEEDVHRLFECFKCGISPPQSAARWGRKKSKRTSKVSVGAAASSTPSPSPHLKVGSASFKRSGSSRKGKQISPGVFYGSPGGVPPKRPISLLRLLREIRLDLEEEQHKDNFSKEVWATFPRQNEALNFAKEHRDVHIFSYQDHHNGQRRFLVSTYQEFWRRYKNMDSKLRHHYEVIQEGLPCHLYFDLEFSKKDNPEKNGNEMVDLLISVIFEALLEKYSIKGNKDWVVELDSSTVDKYSCHLIIRIPKTAFKDNSHVGAFVAEITNRILCSPEGDERFGKLFIIKDTSAAESSSHLFVDTAVYSRNRCFRLALSSKAGKTSVLLPTGRFKCEDMCEEDMFMASLICNIDADCEKLLVCKMDLECVKTLRFDTEVNYDFGRCNFSQGLSLNSLPSDASKTFRMGKSPHPNLDKFVESIASIGTISGQIRSWYWFSEYGLMVYNMSRNRYCERIGRQHKSNHVIYVVDLRRGVYYQKCHDPDCRGYRSPIRQIPLNLILDPSPFCNSVQIELGNGNLEYRHVAKDCESALVYKDEHAIASNGKDSWWLEAVRVADNIESKQKKFGPGNMVSPFPVVQDIDEDDDSLVDGGRSQTEINALHLTKCGTVFVDG